MKRIVLRSSFVEFPISIDLMDMYEKFLNSVHPPKSGKFYENLKATILKGLIFKFFFNKLLAPGIYSFDDFKEYYIKILY